MRLRLWRADPFPPLLRRKPLGAALKEAPAQLGRAIKTPPLRYAGIQGAHCSLMCAATGFSTLFLLEYGVTIQQIGFVMALLNTLSVLVQIITGNWVGRGKGPSLWAAAAFMAGASGLASVGLLLILGRSQPLMLALFIMVGLLTNAMQPLLTSVAMEFVNRGLPMNYGAARGFGSFAYAAMAFGLGRLIARLGTGFLPGVHVAFAVLTAALLWRFRPPSGVPPRRPLPNPPPEAEGRPARAEGDSLLAFVGRYRRFMVLLLGVMCLILCARVLGTYFIRLIQALGGGSAQLGALSAIGALVEFPIMAGFLRLRQRFGCTPLVRLSGVFYTLKSAGLIFAPSMPLLYLANCMQMLAYALFLPSFTYYINQLMEEGDRVRGQAFGMAAMTAGDVLGSLLLGLLPAQMPMRTVLLIALAVSAAGSLIVAAVPRALAEEGR